MMARSVQCDIVSAEKSIFSGLVEQVVACGVEGEMGIRPGHAPLLTQLAPGPVEIRLEGGKEEVLYVSGGFLEVQPHMISILADTAARAKDLDEAEAKRARDRAEQRKKDKVDEINFSKALSDIAKANARLRTLQTYKQKQKR